MYNIADEISLTLDMNNLNLDKLVDAIYIFRAAHNYDPYIICSVKTMNGIMSFYRHLIYDKYYGIDSIYDNSFEGCKILIDHSLPFGEVKIR